MNNLKNSAYWNIYGQCWQFLKESIPPQSNQSYWDSVIAKGESIVKPYAGTPYYDFAVNQSSSVINEIDRLSKVGTFESFQRTENQGVCMCVTQKKR